MSIEDCVCQICNNNCFSPHPEKEGHQRGMGQCYKCSDESLVYCLLCLTRTENGGVLNTGTKQSLRVRLLDG